MKALAWFKAGFCQDKLYTAAKIYFEMWGIIVT